MLRRIGMDEAFTEVMKGAVFYDQSGGVLILRR
jgi:hypothetical protein